MSSPRPNGTVYSNGTVYCCLIPSHAVRSGVMVVGESVILPHQAVLYLILCFHLRPSKRSVIERRTINAGLPTPYNPPMHVRQSESDTGAKQTVAVPVVLSWYRYAATSYLLFAIELLLKGANEESTYVPCGYFRDRCKRSPSLTLQPTLVRKGAAVSRSQICNTI